MAEIASCGIAECPITDAVVSLARRTGPLALRTLDAIHVATATLVDCDLVLAYDQRLLAAAELGFRVEMPRAR